MPPPPNPPPSGQSTRTDDGSVAPDVVMADTEALASTTAPMNSAPAPAMHGTLIPGPIAPLPQSRPPGDSTGGPAPVRNDGDDGAVTGDSRQSGEQNNTAATSQPIAIPATGAPGHADITQNPIPVRVPNTSDIAMDLVQLPEERGPDTSGFAPPRDGTESSQGNGTTTPAAETRIDVDPPPSGASVADPRQNPGSQHSGIHGTNCPSLLRDGATTDRPALADGQPTHPRPTPSRNTRATNQATNSRPHRRPPTHARRPTRAQASTRRSVLSTRNTARRFAPLLGRRRTRRPPGTGQVTGTTRRRLRQGLEAIDEIPHPMDMVYEAASALDEARTPINVGTLMLAIGRPDVTQDQISEALEHWASLDVFTFDREQGVYLLARTVVEEVENRMRTGEGPSPDWTSIPRSVDAGVRTIALLSLFGGMCMDRLALDDLLTRLNARASLCAAGFAELDDNLGDAVAQWWEARANL